MSKKWEELRGELGEKFNRILALKPEEVVDPAAYSRLESGDSEAMESLLRLAQAEARRKADRLPRSDVLAADDRASALLALVAQVRETVAKKIPAGHPEWRKVQSQIGSLLSAYEEARSRTPREAPGGAGAVHGGQADALRSELLEALGAAQTRITSLEEEIRRLTPERLKETQKELQAQLDEARRATEVASEAAKTAGVHAHATEFEREAARHDADARTWLRATVGLAGGTVGLAGFFLFLYLSWRPADLMQLVQVAVVKVVLLSILLSATLWAATNYRSHAHNAVINRHRQNALRTFQAFALASKDGDAKGEVLRQATVCIFSPQTTGFHARNGDGRDVLDVLKASISRNGA